MQEVKVSISVPFNFFEKIQVLKRSSFYSQTQAITNQYWFFFKSHNSLTLSFPGDRLSACQHECSRDPSSCPITGNQYDLLEKSIGVKGHPR